MENNHIYIGDALQTLRQFPNDFFDITVTSPPYNKKGAAGKLVAEVKYKGASDNKEESEYQTEQIDVLNELYRVTKPFGHFFYNHKLRWIDGIMIHPYQWVSRTQWNVRQEIIWDRGIAANIRGWRFWQVEERVYWCQKGVKVGDELLSKHAKMSSVWKIRPEMNLKVHPAPFPIELPIRCIYSIFDDAVGLNVLDPYCGSGTTLVAAKLLKNNYIGIDVCPEYLPLIENRFNDADEISAMEREKNLHFVEKSYEERKKMRFSKTQ